jgi:hypothetical protein
MNVPIWFMRASKEVFINPTPRIGVVGQLGRPQIKEDALETRRIAWDFVYPRMLPQSTHRKTCI